MQPLVIQVGRNTPSQASQPAIHDGTLPVGMPPGSDQSSFVLYPGIRCHLAHGAAISICPQRAQHQVDERTSGRRRFYGIPGTSRGGCRGQDQAEDERACVRENSFMIVSSVIAPMRQNGIDDCRRASGSPRPSCNLPSARPVLDHRIICHGRCAVGVDPGANQADYRSSTGPRSSGWRRVTACF